MSKPHSYRWEIELPRNGLDGTRHHTPVIRQEMMIDGETASEAIKRAFQEFFSRDGEIVPAPGQLRGHYFVAFCKSCNRYLLVIAPNAKCVQDCLTRRKIRCDWIAEISAHKICLTEQIHVSA